MKYLVFTCAGDHHNVAQWSSGHRDYEILVSYYGQSQFRNPTPVDHLRSGHGRSKFQALKDLYDSERALLERFSAVFVIDDDIQITTSQINDLFRIRERFDLDLLSPAQDATGRVSYPSLLRYEGCFGRLTNFCEVCTPLFKAEALFRFLSEYDGSLVGWGIDWWYSYRISQRAPRTIAVIDSVPCRNPHESEKGLTTREIDRLQDAPSRRRSWEEKRDGIGLATAPGFTEYVRVVGELTESTGRTEKKGRGSDIHVSIIVEWENAQLSDAARIPTLLTKLCREINRLSHTVELNVVFDPHADMPEEELRRLLADHGLVGSGRMRLRMHAIPEKHYYDLKNEGVLRATGEIVVFADSDIDPDEGWLCSLVGYLDGNPDVDVVGGFTYVKPTNMVSRAFSAGWFFPLRPDNDQTVLSPARFLWSNNCAYRRETFLAHPYRTSSRGETRGACSRQLKEMKRSGVRVVNVPAAVVGHPAPHGLRHFVIRALAQGRDCTVDSQLARSGISTVSRFKSLCGTAIGNVVKTAINSVRETHRLDSSVLQAPVSVAIMTVYYALFVLGGAYALAFPESAGRIWRI